MPAGSTYTPIATVTLTSTTTSLTISSIPQTYTDLAFTASMTTDADTANIILRFNNDSSTLYSATSLSGTGSTVTTYKESNQGRVLITTATASSNATVPGVLVGSVMNYANTTTNKTAIWRWNVPSATYPGVLGQVALYRSTSAITQINLIASGNNFTAGSTFTLYGITAA